MSVFIDRFESWMLLALGLAAGIALPHPVTTALWTAATRAFERAGDVRMVERLTSGTKFGSRIQAGLRGDTLGHPRFA
ncbi:hypothetical protein BH10PSE3_BH10PSE3_07320 [soil metagenome]